MSKLGHDFGTTPFGWAQVAAHAARRCLCDPRLRLPLAVCPQHGLAQHLRKLATEKAAA